MAEKGNGQHIAAVNDNNDAETNLEQGISKFGEEAKRIQSLGSVRLRNENTGEIVLVPTPTKDPNDPLVLPLPLSRLTVTELVSSFQICYHGLGMLCYLSLQFPRCRASYRYCRDCPNLLPSRDTSGLGWKYRKNCLFLYDYRVGAGCPPVIVSLLISRESVTSSGCHSSTNLVVDPPMSSLSSATLHARSGPVLRRHMGLSSAPVLSWASWPAQANVWPH